jgi:hypothetical protein
MTSAVPKSPTTARNWLINPTAIANTSRLDPLEYLDYTDSITGSSPSTPPPLVSPSLLIPLEGEVFATTLPTPGPSRQIGHRNTSSQYREVLEKLDHASIQDEQMLSSFKRESNRRKANHNVYIS